MSARLRNHYPMLTVLLAVVAVFVPVTGFEFLNYDDPANVYENPLLSEFTGASLRVFWSGPYQGLYIPLTYTLWGGLAGLAGLLWPAPTGMPEPAVFHAANLLVHLASVLLFFHLLRRLLKDDWAAAAGALFFGVHPVQVEAVAWVTGMKDLLGGFFSILALERYLFYPTVPGPGQLPVARRRYAAASLFFAFALLAKPSAVTVPLLAGTVGFFCLGRPLRQLVRELSPWLLLTIPVLIVTRSAQPGAQNFLDYPIWQRLLVAGDALSFYLGKLFWPVELAPDYGRTPALVLAGGWTAYVTLIPPLGVAGFLWWRRSAPWLRAGGLVFFLALMPVLGLVPFDFQKISTVADRYLYPALLGPGLVAAWLASRFRGRLVAISLIAVLLLLGLASVVNLRHWRDSLVFNRHALRVNPSSTMAYNNLGAAYQDAGKFREALDAYRRAIEIAPEVPDAYVNMGNLYAKARMTGEAIVAYRQALSRVPQNYGLVYRKLGDAHQSRQEYEPALSNYRQALYYFRLAKAQGIELARVHAAIGLVYKAMGRNEEAIGAYRQALLEKADFTEALSNLGVIFEELGRTAEAEEAYRQAVNRKPTLAEPYNNLGQIYLGQQRVQEAVVLFRRAVELSPRQPVPLHNLGRAYLALGQYEPAQVAFQQALKINPGYAPSLAGMAQLYRRTGREDLAGEYRARATALGYPEPTGVADGTAGKQPARP